MPAAGPACSAGCATCRSAPGPPSRAGAPGRGGAEPGRGLRRVARAVAWAQRGRSGPAGRAVIAPALAFPPYTRRMRRSRGLTVLLVLCAFAGGLAVAKPLSAGRFDPYRKLAIFSKVLSYIENNYVEDISESDLMYGAARGLTDVLDPHSRFMDPDEYERLRKETEGDSEITGIGIDLEKRKRGLVVISAHRGLAGGAGRDGAGRSDPQDRWHRDGRAGVGGRRQPHPGPRGQRGGAGGGAARPRADHAHPARALRGQERGGARPGRRLRLRQAAHLLVEHRRQAAGGAGGHQGAHRQDRGDRRG